MFPWHVQFRPNIKALPDIQIHYTFPCFYDVANISGFFKHQCFWIQAWAIYRIYWICMVKIFKCFIVFLQTDTNISGNCQLSCIIGCKFFCAFNIYCPFSAACMVYGLSLSFRLFGWLPSITFSSNQSSFVSKRLIGTNLGI